MVTLIILSFISAASFIISMLFNLTISSDSNSKFDFLSAACKRINFDKPKTKKENNYPTPSQIYTLAFSQLLTLQPNPPFFIVYCLIIILPKNTKYTYYILKTKRLVYRTTFDYFLRRKIVFSSPIWDLASM